MASKKLRRTSKRTLLKRRKKKNLKSLHSILGIISRMDFSVRHRGQKLAEGKVVITDKLFLCLKY